MMRSKLLAAAVFLATLMPAGASLAFDDPKALINAIYEPYQRKAEHADLTPFYSSRLKMLFANQMERDSVEPVVFDAAAPTVENTSAVIGAEPGEAASFNPFVQGDGVLLFDLVVGEPVIIGDRALVSVSFHNFDHPSLLSLSLAREADGWKVDDVSSMGPDEHWLLSWLLTYDPLGL